MGAATFFTYAKRDACPCGLKQAAASGARAGQVVLEQAYGPWPNAETAMEHLADQDRAEHGHMNPDNLGGKWGLVHIGTVDDQAEAGKLAATLIEEDDPRISDKRGPAGCITIRNGENQYLFFGWVAT